MEGGTEMKLLIPMLVGLVIGLAIGFGVSYFEEEKKK